MSGRKRQEGVGANTWELPVERNNGIITDVRTFCGMGPITVVPVAMVAAGMIIRARPPLSSYHHVLHTQAPCYQRSPP